VNGAVLFSIARQSVRAAAPPPPPDGNKGGPENGRSVSPSK
ncbi:hypothetical protein GWI33_001066, partial [Rhynchophorus ferrugineus]